jgi:hypothetical protein
MEPAGDCLAGGCSASEAGGKRETGGSRGTRGPPSSRQVFSQRYPGAQRNQRRSLAERHPGGRVLRCPAVVLGVWVWAVSAFFACGASKVPAWSVSSPSKESLFCHNVFPSFFVRDDVELDFKAAGERVEQNRGEAFQLGLGSTPRLPVGPSQTQPFSIVTVIVGACTVKRGSDTTVGASTIPHTIRAVTRVEGSGCLCLPCRCPYCPPEAKSPGTLGGEGLSVPYCPPPRSQDPQELLVG